MTIITKTLLLFMLPIILSAQEKHDLQIDQMSLSESLVIISELCDLELTMSQLKDDNKYSKTYQQRTCEDMLSDLLSVTAYTYTRQDDMIIIHRRPAEPQSRLRTRPKQKKYTISGYIYDDQTGETLIGANVYSTSDEQGTSTNVYGFYSLTLPEGTKELQISYVGYQSMISDVDLSADVTHSYRLEGANSIEEIVITADATERIEDQAKMSTISLPVQELNTLPSIVGEVDIIKALQLMPGVQAGTEGFAGLYVRGGTSDQNLIMLDGVPIYNASHLFGIFSVFNADAIKSTELIKGGYPARYGGRLSSILDIRMKDGNMKEWKGAGSIGLISSKLTLEGPIIKDKMSVMVSGRRTYLDVFVKPIVAYQRKKYDEKGTPTFFFHDVNAKLNYKISDKDRVYLSFFNGHDKFGDQRKRDYRFDNQSYTVDEKAFFSWQNQITALRWNHVFSNKLFSNLTLTNTAYQLEVGNDNKTTTLVNDNKSVQSEFYKYQSRINDNTVKLDFDYIMSPQSTLRFGAEYIDHRFEPGALRQKDGLSGSARDTTIGGLPLPADKIMAYVESEVSPTEWLTLNLGLNASLFFSMGKSYKNVEPRLLSNIKLSDRWSAKASYTLMNQYLHLLTPSGIGLPTDLWLPPTDRVPEQKSWQAGLGLAHTMPSGMELSLEGYYKRLNNLLSYRPGASFILFGDGWEDKVTTGMGTSYGMEVLVKKSFGKTKGWIGYTLSKTTRQFDEINRGRPYPFKFDRTHDLSISLTHEFSDKWKVGANWIYTTGQATTIPLEIFDGRGSPYNIGSSRSYGEKNSIRFKPYHRLDLSFSYHKKTKWGNSSFHFDIYNAYNRLNTFYIDNHREYGFIGIDDSGKAQFGERQQLKSISILPIIPSFRWDFKF